MSPEAAAVERITHERQQRGWSLDTAAKRVTAAGCPLHRTALYKIEKGQRKVTVDELVTFAGVYDLPIDQLLDVSERTLRSQVAALEAQLQHARAQLQKAGMPDD